LNATGWVIWVVLSLIIAFVAKRKGYSYLGFLLLSLVLSPIIGFVILIVRGILGGGIALFKRKKYPVTYTVYVSRSGSKYHSNEGCPALRSAQMIGSIALEDAIKSGLTACEKCM
jgi:hypothetical protein